MKRLKLLSKARIVILSSVAQLGSPAALEARRLGAFDVIAKPSGASGTVICAIECGCGPVRSTTLTASMLPSAEPPNPLSAVIASLESGVTTTLYGNK